MKEIAKLSAFGLLLHQTKHFSDHAPDGWRNLTEHAVGGVGIFLVWPHMARVLGADDDEIKRGQAALAIALLGIGGGVVAGWIIDTMYAIWKGKNHDTLCAPTRRT